MRPVDDMKPVYDEYAAMEYWPLEDAIKLVLDVDPEDDNLLIPHMVPALKKKNDDMGGDSYSLERLVQEKRNEIRADIRGLLGHVNRAKDQSLWPDKEWPVQEDEDGCVNGKQFITWVMEKRGKASPGLREALGMKSSETTSAQFPTPEGTQWDKVAIRVTDGDGVLAQTRNISKKYACIELGFKDSRKGNTPDEIWITFKMLARFNGELGFQDHKNPGDKEKYQKHISIIRKRLKNFMQIDDDPFFPYQEYHAYKTKFLLSYPDSTSEQLTR